MPSKSATCLLLLFIVFPFFASAQNDYVVLENGDTLYGKIKRNLFGKMRIVSPNQEIKINENVKAYYLSKDSASYYNIMHPVMGEKVFMYAVGKGEINLYSYSSSITTYNGGTITTTDWYIEKNGSPLELIKSSGLAGGRKDRKDILRALIADKPEILKLYEENDSFTFNNIRKLINEYNRLMPPTFSNQ